MPTHEKLKSIARNLSLLTALLEVLSYAAETSTGTSMKAVLIDACNDAFKLREEVEELIDHA